MDVALQLLLLISSAEVIATVIVLIIGILNKVIDITYNRK